MLTSQKCAHYVSLFFLFIIAFLAIGSHHAQAETSKPEASKVETTQDALAALAKLKTDLKGLNYFAERIDKGRILVLEKRIDAVEKIVSGKGLGNMDTLNSYQEMVLAFKFSEAFFTSNSTELSEKIVQSVKKTVAAIGMARGFDENLNSGVVAGILRQTHTLVQQLATEQLPGDLGQWIKTSLTPQLGEALSTSKALGDRPASYQKGNEIYQVISRRYTDLQKINPKNGAYNVVTELMGLMELYKDIATQGLSPEKEK